MFVVAATTVVTWNQENTSGFWWIVPALGCLVALLPACWFYLRRKIPFTSVKRESPLLEFTFPKKNPPPGRWETHTQYFSALQLFIGSSEKYQHSVQGTPLDHGPVLYWPRCPTVPFPPLLPDHYCRDVLCQRVQDRLLSCLDGALFLILFLDLPGYHQHCLRHRGGCLVCTLFAVQKSVREQFQNYFEACVHHVSGQHLLWVLDHCARADCAECVESSQNFHRRW